MHTEREKQLESDYFQVMVECQNLIFAASTRDNDGFQLALTRIQKRVLTWREDVMVYLQHPSWQESLHGLMDNLAEPTPPAQGD